MADGQKPKEATEVPLTKDERYVPDDSDSTKSRRLAEDYDSTKNGMDYGKDQGTHILRKSRQRVKSQRLNTRLQDGEIIAPGLRCCSRENLC